MPYPLDGVRILELGQIIAGTYGGQLLSDMGAEVIKVEAPEGDLGRNPSIAPYRGASGLFLTFNRNKRSIVINLKTEAGRNVFHDLVKVSDVVVDNFRPGVLERLRIDYATLSWINPRIIQCSITGFGSAGEYKDYPALDIIIQAISGHMAITGEPGRPPVRVGIPIGDLSGGIFSCMGILAALVERERTGKGCSLELSLFDAMLNLLTYMGTMWLTNGTLPRPPGSSHDYTVPWQAFEATDGYLVVGTRQERFWRSLCAVLEEAELANDPRFATNASRVENRAALEPETRSDLPDANCGGLAQAAAGSRSAGRSGQQPGRCVRGTARRGTRDDRRVRSSRRRQGETSRESDQDSGGVGAYFQTCAAARRAYRCRAR